MALRWLHTKDINAKDFFLPNEGESLDDFQTRFIRNIFPLIKDDKLFTDFLEGNSDGEKFVYYEEDMKDIDTYLSDWSMTLQDYNENMLNAFYDFCDGERIALQ